MGEYHLQDAIREFLAGSRIQGNLRSLQITDVWSDLMGPLIAGYTDRIQIFGDKLFIHTQVAPLRQELSLQRDTIIQRVNEALGEIVIREVIIK